MILACIRHSQLLLSKVEIKYSSKAWLGSLELEILKSVETTCHSGPWRRVSILDRLEGKGLMPCPRKLLYVFVVLLQAFFVFILIKAF